MELWVHGLPQDRTAGLETARRLGISHVVLGSNREAIDQAVEAGCSVYACTHAFGFRKEDPEHLLCLTITGERKAWFRSNCPSRPEVQERHLEKVRELAGIPGIKGVFIDGARFASPASGIETFLTCFCDACKSRAESLGFDFDRMRRDVAALYEGLRRSRGDAGREFSAGAPPSAVDLLRLAVLLPGIVDWFRFRALCTAEHIRQVRETLKSSNADLVLGMYVFTPCLSALVGQVYPLLAEHVDIFAPMIYRNGPPDSIAPLNSELARLWRDLSDVAGIEPGAAAAAVLSFVGLDGLLSEHTPEALAAALPPEVVRRETASARALLEGHIRLAPIIWLQDDEIERSARAVQSGGADGVSFFSFKEGAEALLERAVAALDR